MDFNSSLDDIIKARHRRPSHARHAYHSSSTIKAPPSYASRISTSAPYTVNNYYSRHGYNHHDSHQRRSLSNTRQLPFKGTSDLRERIGNKSMPTSTDSGLSTANLPNRQRMQQKQQKYQSGISSDSHNGSGNKQDRHSIVIKKPVLRNNHSSSSSSSSSFPISASTNAPEGWKSNRQVDPSSIVITKAVKKMPSSSSSSSSSPPATAMSTTSRHHPGNEQPAQHESAPISSPPPMNSGPDQILLPQSIGDQPQEQLQMSQQTEQQLQEQLKSQNEQILELQRLLSQQRMATDLADPRQYDSPLTNSGRPISSPSNTVVLSNLDPMATSADIEIVCGGFGIVVRCDMARDSQGRSCGGEAEVEFLDHDSALNCIAKLDSELVDNRIIRATLRTHPMQHTRRPVIAPTRSGYRTTSQILYTDNRH